MATTLTRRTDGGTLSPWRVFDELEHRMWDWFNTPLGLTPLSRMLEERVTFMPPVNIYETADDVFVAASLPGIDASKVNVQVENGYLKVTGEQKPIVPADEKTEYTTHCEGIRHYGQFSFTLSLPWEVNAENADAQYEDGILRIRFPKALSARPVRIPVSAGKQPATLEAGGKAAKK